MINDIFTGGWITEESAKENLARRKKENKDAPVFDIDALAVEFFAQRNEKAKVEFAIINAMSSATTLTPIDLAAIALGVAVKFVRTEAEKGKSVNDMAALLADVFEEAARHEDVIKHPSAIKKALALI